MSAYVVEHKTIHIVVSHLSELNNWNQSKLRDATGLSISISEEHRTALCQQMLELNIESVAQRYPDHTRPEHTLITHRYEAASEIQVYKSLQCWLYQTCEGNCDQHPLYVVMNELHAALAHHIVTNLPDYEEAEW